MKKIFYSILYSVLIFSICACSSIKQEKQYNMISNFYNEYLSSIDDIKLNKEVLNKYCSKQMLETLEILYSFDKEEGIIVGIDYDPFLNAQDSFPIESLKIHKVLENTYNVSFDKTDISINLNVVKENGKYKINSLDSYDLDAVKKEVDEYWTLKKQQTK